MCPMDLIALHITLHYIHITLHISLMWSLKDKILSITMPKFLAFALIPIVLFANIKVSKVPNIFRYTNRLTSSYSSLYLSKYVNVLV